MTNLYLFPALPNETSGYELAVKSDISDSIIRKQDIVVFFSNKELDDISSFNHKVFFVKRKKSFTRTLISLCKLTHPSFFHKCDWEELPDYIKNINFKNVYFGDVIFFPLLKKINYEAYEFRFHNLWTRVLHMNSIFSFGIKNLVSMWYISRVEKKLINQGVKINMISEVDRLYALKSSENIGFKPINIEIFKTKKLDILIEFKNKPTIIWFGSVSLHKRKSLVEFISVFKRLKKEIPDLTFLLFGRYTEMFDERSNGIYSYGIYKDNFSLPYSENCIYINPDRIGGGIKIKNFDIIKNSNISYLTTPKGFEGCETYLREGIEIVSFSEWPNFLIRYFKTNKKTANYLITS